MADAEARRLERLCQARQQMANILKMPRNERWDVSTGWGCRQKVKLVLYTTLHIRTCSIWICDNINICITAYIYIYTCLNLGMYHAV